MTDAQFECGLFKTIQSKKIFQHSPFWLSTDKKNKTKQNKTKHNTTQHNKTKQNKTKQNKTKQNKTKQNKTQNKTKQNKNKNKKTVIAIWMLLSIMKASDALHNDIKNALIYTSVLYYIQPILGPFKLI